jgi:hypothetical protein
MNGIKLPEVGSFIFYTIVFDLNQLLPQSQGENPVLQ